MANTKIYRVEGQIFIEVEGLGYKEYFDSFDFDIKGGIVYVVDESPTYPKKLNFTLEETQDIKGEPVGDLEAVERYLSNLSIGVGSNENELPLSAFGDLRTIELSPIFQLSFEYTVDNTELVTNISTNGGTVTQNQAMAITSTSTTTGSTALLQSNRHAKYRAGLGGLYRFTSLFTAGVVGTDQLIGLADVNGVSTPFKNGYMIGCIGDVFGFHRFIDDTLVSVPLSEFDDPLDGTGESGMIIDLTKLNVWEIRFQYLGAGAIELTVEDDSTGKFTLAHRILYANLNVTPSVLNPNFHGTIWVDNGNTTANIILKSASMAYFIEGKNEFLEIQQPQQTSGLQVKTGVTTQEALFTIRNKSTYQGKENFIDVVLQRAISSVEANANNNLGEVFYIKNAILGGTPVFSDINTSNSVVEIDTAGTTITGGKVLIGSLLAGKDAADSIDMTPFTMFLAPNETVTIAISSDNNATFKSGMLWKELF